MEVQPTEPADDRQREPDGVSVVVMPQVGFAAGALLVATVGLAFVLGRRYQAGLEPIHDADPTAVQTIEQARARPAISYSRVPVDRPDR